MKATGDEKLEEGTISGVQRTTSTSTGLASRGEEGAQRAGRKVVAPPPKTWANVRQGKSGRDKLLRKRLPGRKKGSGGRIATREKNGAVRFWTESISGKNTRGRRGHKKNRGGTWKGN